MSERKNDKIVYARKDNRVTCILTLKEAAALDKAAEEANVSRSHFVRKAIRRELKMRALKKVSPYSNWRKRKNRRVYE